MSSPDLRVVEDMPNGITNVQEVNAFVLQGGMAINLSNESCIRTPTTSTKVTALSNDHGNKFKSLRYSISAQNMRYSALEM